MKHLLGRRLTLLTLVAAGGLAATVPVVAQGQGSVRTAKHRPAVATLGSGKTESGIVGGAGYAPAGSKLGFAATFPIPLKHYLLAPRVIYANPLATHCPGIGQADRGYLCVYQESISNFNTPTSTNIEGVASSGRAEEQGFFLTATTSATAVADIRAIWSVTGR